MSEIITAVYSNGMLRPQNPLSLTDGEIVRLQVLTLEASKVDTINASGWSNSTADNHIK